jgi:hypothetical protein
LFGRLSLIVCALVAETIGYAILVGLSEQPLPLAAHALLFSSSGTFLMLALVGKHQSGTDEPFDH